jgi:peptide/nickel transport system substrate-binding protein
MTSAKSTRRFRLTAGLALTVAVSLAAAACSSSGSSGSSGGGGSGSVFTIGTENQLQHLDPFDYFEPMDYSVGQMIYPALDQWTSSAQPAPDLAKSWSHSSDGSTWTFNLYSDAKWSDGKPITANDVAFTFATILKYKASYAAIDDLYIEGLTSVTASNPTTVVFHFNSPNAGFLSYVPNIPILPEHVWAKVATGTGSGLTKFATTLPIVSGGPFKPVSWNGTTTLLMERNPNFWGPNKPGPSLDRVGLQYYYNPDTLIDAIKNHQIDYANQVTPTSASALKGVPGIDLTVYKSSELIALYYNMKAPANTATSNVLVREALDDAIDRAQIASVAYPGAQVGESILTSRAVDYDAAIQPTFDVAKANALLDQAGYKMGPGGFRLENGKPLTFTILVDQQGLGGAGLRTFQLLSADFAKIGVKLNEDALDTAAMFTKLYGTNDNYAGGWDALLETNSLVYDPAEYLVGFTTGSIGSYNWNGWSNPHFDSLYLQSIAAFDPATRQNLVDEAQEYAYQQHITSVLAYLPFVDAHLNSWTGFGPGAGGSFSYLGYSAFTSVHSVG